MPQFRGARMLKRLSKRTFGGPVLRNLSKVRLQNRSSSPPQQNIAQHCQALFATQEDRTSYLLTLFWAKRRRHGGNGRLSVIDASKIPRAWPQAARKVFLLAVSAPP